MTAETQQVDRDRLLDSFLGMVRINTPARHEKSLADAVQARLEALGFSCARDTADRHTGGDSGNLVATLAGNAPGGLPIFFSAHFDTVEPNPGLQVQVVDGVVRTDGTTILGADDKCGVAAILEAMHVIVEKGLPHGDIQLLLSVCEEVGLLGARYLDRSLVRARMGYVLDTGPPVGAIVTAAPTHDVLDVVITGQAAHAGFEPEKGISAIQVAARAIDRLRLGRLDHETTANVGVIAGGAATNVVCSEVKLRAEARSRDPEKVAAQVEHMVETFHEAAADFGAGIDITVTRQYDGYRLADDAPVVAMARAAAEDAGLPTSTKAAGGGSDANVYNNSGLPACVLGTGMVGVHTHDEHIAVDDLVRSAEWLLAIVRRAARGDA